MGYTNSAGYANTAIRSGSKYAPTPSRGPSFLPIPTLVTSSRPKLGLALAAAAVLFSVAVGAAASSHAFPSLIACPASVAAAGGTYTPYTGDPLQGPDGYTQTVKDEGDYLESSCQWRIRGKSTASIRIRWSTSSSYQLLGSCQPVTDAYLQTSSETHKVVVNYFVGGADQAAFKEVAHRLLAGAEHLAAPCKETGPTGGGTQGGVIVHPWSVHHAAGYAGRDQDDRLYVALTAAAGSGSVAAGPSGAVTRAKGSLRVVVVATRHKGEPNGSRRSFTLVVGKGGKLMKRAGGFRLVLNVHVSPTRLADADLDCLAAPDGTMTIADGRGSDEDELGLDRVCGFTGVRGTYKVAVHIG